MFGFSIYKQNYSRDYIQKMIDLGIKDVFISLHVLEELEDKQSIIDYLEELKEFDLNLITDISPVTLENFSLAELSKYNIKTLRIDFGFSLDDVIEFKKNFKIVLNASTLTEEEIQYLKSKEVNLSEITLMHNFYPKEETGLSHEMFETLNANFRKHGFKILGFVPGDKELRGPIYKGLPMIEEHRNQPFLVNCIDLLDKIDQTFIADIEVSDESIKYLEYLKNNIIPIPVSNVELLDSKFLNVPVRIRIDSNHLNLRIEDSRFALKTDYKIAPNNSVDRKKGFITQDNELSKRYNGEIMVCRTDLPSKENLNVVGKILEGYEKIVDSELAGKKIIFMDN